MTSRDFHHERFDMRRSANDRKSKKQMRERERTRDRERERMRFNSSDFCRHSCGFLDTRQNTPLTISNQQVGGHKCHRHRCQHHIPRVDLKRNTRKECSHVGGTEKDVVDRVGKRQRDVRVIGTQCTADDEPRDLWGMVASQREREREREEGDCLCVCVRAKR